MPCCIDYRAIDAATNHHAHGEIGWAGRSRAKRVFAEDRWQGAEVNMANWLRVLDTAESSQVDQCVGHQLHALMPLLDTFETE
jgi:hypothetical protein